ncbi:unnamed protein product [Amoebophrya sp. A120]|nr:unnamed protein product [Amoebophrya sp. A120]|eukprot:GSA120T00010374001.1
MSMLPPSLPPKQGSSTTRPSSKRPGESATNSEAGNTEQEDAQKVIEEYRKRRRLREEEERRQREQDEEDLLDGEDEQDEDEKNEPTYVPLKERKKQRNQELNRLRRKAELIEDDEEKEKEQLEEKLKKILAERSTGQSSLLAQSAEIRAKEEANSEDKDKQLRREIEESEAKIMEQLQYQTPLVSRQENAKGIKYKEPMPAIGQWRPLAKHRLQSEAENEKLREMFMFEAAGADLPPPLKKFEYMRFPKGLVDALVAKGIKKPTQIQMQGIPAALAGRDLIGIAFTGSGKTMCFLLPLIMKAMECELKKPMSEGEGPFGLMLAPSRELAVQTEENLKFLLYHLHNDTTSELWRRNRRQIKFALLIGGAPMGPQINTVKRGVHIVIATPGRLNGLLQMGKMHLKQCQLMAMDEADRMVDATFEEEVRITLDHFSGQRQTLLFSATMPRKIQNFAAGMLTNPVVVNVGRAGSANLDILQEIAYVKQEDKHKAVLDSLSKTPPPVLVFCDNKADVDDVHEYLLLKGVDAVAIHGGMDQQERLESINDFKTGKKSVLIGTDVASKGLDFPLAIQHVVNYDMPKEIENYIHRIGRTGRRGQAGVATTFINKIQCTDGILLDLKAVLEESKQKIHPVLEKIVPPPGHEVAEIGGVKGCVYCGGLGHRVAACPKLETAQRESTKSDVLITGSRHGGTAGYGGDW